MSGTASRRKGHGFERFVARALQVCFPDSEISRGLQYRDPTMCDVEGTPFRIECKAQKKFSYESVHKAIEQAELDGQAHNDSRFPVAITKKDFKSPLVHMKLVHFIGMIEKHFWRPPEDEYEVVE